MGQYINVNSNHPDHVKRGVIKMLYSHVVRVCLNTSLLWEDVKKICRDFNKNDYNDQYVKIIYRVASGKTHDDTWEMTSPYLLFCTAEEFLRK